MPKETTTRSTRGAARKHPISKPEKPKSPTAKSTTTKQKDGRDSHLYTDDNPKTTIHGTGFKDKAAAKRTLQLIENRSLIYQFQTVNTMYNRAKHHPSMKKDPNGTTANTSDIRSAMTIFREWLDVTYPASQAALRAGGFKPLVSKKTVQRHLESIQQSSGIADIAKTFARIYCELPKGKKLGNVLLNDEKPMEADWDKRRHLELDELVPEGKEEEAGWKASELWEDGDAKKKVISEEHLKFIAWAWSPVDERKLP